MCYHLASNVFSTIHKHCKLDITFFDSFTTSILQNLVIHYLLKNTNMKTNAILRSTPRCFNNIITCLSLFLFIFKHNTPTRCRAFNMRTLFFIICHITTEILATIYIGSNCKKWVLWVLLIVFFPHMILKLCLLNALVVFKESGCINYLNEKNTFDIHVNDNINAI